MENASKALIIAGAILLSILIISLGIMVYNNAKGTVSDSNLDAESVQTFNTKFTQYQGTQKGSKLNSLIDTVISNNGSSSHTITINDGEATTAGRYNNSESKTVKFEYGADGYIDNIVIN